MADWRRQQIDIFIHDLSVAMREFNQRNNRYVQLGISPTGIYKNGGSGFAYGGQDRYDSNGNFITNGSNTGGQEHYASYLYSNTKNGLTTSGSTTSFRKPTGLLLTPQPHMPMW